MGPNIRYELLEIERLIGSGAGEQSDDKFAALTLTVLNSEVDRIRSTFIQEIFSFTDELLLERYIQYHQRAIINLMDDLARQQPKSKTSKHLNAQFYKALGDLLRFIERYFSKYFDLNSKAPTAYLMVAGKVAQRNIVRLKRKLHSVGVDTELTDLIIGPINQIIPKSHITAVTYKNVMYAHIVQDELFRLLSAIQEKSEVNAQLRQFMIYINYNHEYVLDNLFRYVDLLVRDQSNRLDKIEALSHFLKVVNQTHPKPGVVYDETVPSVKHLLSDYVNEEIIFQSRLNAVAATEPSIQKDFFKMKLDVSVAQVSLIVKAFVETKVIQNSNLSELLRSAASAIVTKKSENMSYDSLRAKYYNVEHSTRMSVRHIFSTIVQYIDKE